MAFSPEALRARKEAAATKEVVGQGSNIFETGGALMPTEQEPKEENKELEGTQAEALAKATEPQQSEEAVEEKGVVKEEEELEEVEEKIEEEEESSQDVEQIKPASTVVAVGNAEEGITATTLSEKEVVATTVKDQPGLETPPSITDSNAFQQLAKSSEESLPATDSYAELVENMVSRQCQLSGVKNLDLTTFGLRAQVLNFPTLTVLTYGQHKFLGAPFTDREEDLIVHRLGLYVAQSDKNEIVVSAVKEIKDERGMSFYSLLFNDKIAQKFADMFNYTVRANMNEADVSKLVLVIQK